MNFQIKKLAGIAGQPSRLIVGLMSGTSMDGLDIALCRCNGYGENTHADVLKFKTAPYPDDFKQDIKEIFSRRDADLQKVCIMNARIGSFHARLILDALSEWGVLPGEVDVIASHGQTIFHAPRSYHRLESYPDSTLQIGDGDHIAVKTGIITISDFRQKHIAGGGEGAPLAVYGDYLIFSKKGEDRVMLNIGGIANFTYLPADGNPESVFSTDVGPGNTLMDQFVQRNYPGLFYDDDAALARQGTVNEQLLRALSDNKFFDLSFPKTTGPELFNLEYLEKAQESSGTQEAGNEDILATLCELTSREIVRAIRKCFAETNNLHVYLSGGGMHNPLLVEKLRVALPDAVFGNTDLLGINPDAKEAVLFALLANETICGSAIKIGSGPSVTMGKISLPF